jgi:hypothetical protein
VVGVAAGVVVFGVLGVVFEPLEGVLEAGFGVLVASGIFGGLAVARRADAGGIVVGVPGFGVAGGGVAGVGVAGVGVVGVAAAGGVGTTLTMCTCLFGPVFSAA